MVGQGAGSIQATIEPDYIDRGSQWGWRLVASTDAGTVLNPAPFAQLDYSSLNRTLQAIRSDCAARGILYSSFCDSMQRDAKDAFFNAGVDRDFGIARSLFGSTQPISLTVSGPWSGNSCLVPERPGRQVSVRRHRH